MNVSFVLYHYHVTESVYKGHYHIWAYNMWHESIMMKGMST